MSCNSCGQKNCLTCANLQITSPESTIIIEKEGDCIISLDVNPNYDFGEVGQVSAENIGTGEGIFAQKVANTLQFKSLVPGTNIGITSDANEITISNTAANGGVTQASTTFNATTDWTGPSGGYYSFAWAHNAGTAAIMVTIWDATGTLVQVFPEIIEQTDTNTLTIKVSDTPDNKFAGRIVISY